MIEHRMPIPSRAYNAAVGGHVCGPEDIDFGQKVVHLIKYDKDGNEVSFESQVTQANKIYVIHDDFTLSSNVTIPANCVLEFDGGSINGEYTLTLNNTLIEGLNCISYDTTIAGICKNTDIFVEWFIGTDLQKIQAAMDYSRVAVVRDETTETTGFKIEYKRVVFGNHKQYVIDNSINLPSLFADIEGNHALIKITTNNNIIQANGGPSYLSIKNLILMGDDVCGLYLNVGNLDGAMTTLSNVIFETSTRSQGKFGIYLHNQSSQIIIERCTARSCPNFLKVYCDSLIIRDCWINGYYGSPALKPNDTCSIELENGCRYSRIENCQFIPEGDSAGNSVDTRWIDWKGGVLSITNTIFGGENSGLPIIWKYFSDSQLSICDSQCAASAAKARGGIVTLMDGIMPGRIYLRHTKTYLTRFINPYGYVKGSVATYDDSALQDAWDAFVDAILLLPNFDDVGFIDCDVEEYYNSYPIFPIMSIHKKSVINNVDVSKTYVIARNLFTENIGNRDVALSCEFEIIISGNASTATTFMACYKYKYLAENRYGILSSSMILEDSCGLGYNNDDILSKLTVTFDKSFNLNVAILDNAYHVNTINAVIRDKVYIINPYGINKSGVVLLPQKCNMINT